MANPHKYYLSHMHDKSGFRGAWDPGRIMELGFIGKLDKYGVFSVFTSLKDEGIDSVPGKEPQGNSIDYTSSKGVTIKLKASGDAPVINSALTKVDAGFSIDFESEKGVVFQSDGLRTTELVNLKNIENKVLEKFNNDNWEKDWLIVTHVVKTDTTTVIISNSSKSTVELKANGAVGAGGLKLTDVSLGLSVVSESGSTLKFIAKQGLTPLYRVMGLDRALFGDWEIISKGPRGLGSEHLTDIEFDIKELADY